MTNEELFEANKKIVYYCFKMMSGDDFVANNRDDILQEGFLALWKGILGFNPDYGVKPVTYFFQAVKRAMRRWVKVNKDFCYKHMSLDACIETEDNDVGSLYDLVACPPEVKFDVESLLSDYEKYLYETRGYDLTEKQKEYVAMRVANAADIIKAITKYDLKTTREIESECNVSRTIISIIINDLKQLINKKENYLYELNYTAGIKIDGCPSK